MKSNQRLCPLLLTLFAINNSICESKKFHTHTGILDIEDHLLSQLSPSISSIANANTNTNTNINIDTNSLNNNHINLPKLNKTRKHDSNSMFLNELNELQKNAIINKKSQKNQNKNNNKQKRRRLISEFSNSQKETILDTHNDIRAETALGDTGNQPRASNMNELMWDEGLASIAQDYSENCIWAHNSDRSSQLQEMGSDGTSFVFDENIALVGENLYVTTSKETNIKSLINYGMEAFYEEYDYYDYDDDECESGQICGHYTQLVWSQTRYVGCGWTRCDDIEVNDVEWHESWLFVCNYYPSQQGKQPYTKGSPCSDCDSDRTDCTNSDALCGGCVSDTWGFCNVERYSNCDEYEDKCDEIDCDLSDTDDLCTGCRKTCDTCPDSWLEANTCSNGIDDYGGSDETDSPTERPTNEPTERPTSNPTDNTPRPTNNPTERPTNEPTERPTTNPTDRPTTNPTDPQPVARVTPRPTDNPTNRPTLNPTERPTINPTERPTLNPTERPTTVPTIPDLAGGYVPDVEVAGNDDDSDDGNNGDTYTSSSCCHAYENDNILLEDYCQSLKSINDCRKDDTTMKVCYWDLDGCTQTTNCCTDCFYEWPYEGLCTFLGCNWICQSSEQS